MNCIIHNEVRSIIVYFCTILLTLSFSHKINAQKQIVGDPNTCPLCNPPLEIVKIRGMNYNLHEFPIVHLFEGEHSKSKYTLYQFVGMGLNATLFNQGFFTDMNDMSQITKTQISDILDPHKFVNPSIRIISQSKPNTLISARAKLETAKESVTNFDTFSMQVVAGRPGKTAVAWLYGSAGKMSLTRDTHYSTQMNFILPVVVHPSPVPLFIQEMTITPADKKKKTKFFFLDAQFPENTVRPIAQQCPTKYHGFNLWFTQTKLAHQLSIEGNNNCVDLISVLSSDNDDFEDREVRRILLIVNDGSKKDGLPLFSTSTYEDRVFIGNKITRTTQPESETVKPQGE